MELLLILEVGIKRQALDSVANQMQFQRWLLLPFKEIRVSGRKLFWNGVYKLLGTWAEL